MRAWTDRHRHPVPLSRLGPLPAVAPRRSRSASGSSATLISAAANSVTALMDVRRAGLDFARWEPVVWEWSSSLVMLALVPAVVWFTRRVPLHLDTWRRALPLHLVGSVAWSLLHVAGMVALRKLAYATQGDGLRLRRLAARVRLRVPQGRPQLRRHGRDDRGATGWLLRRLQGEASMLAAPDDARRRPERGRAPRALPGAQARQGIPGRRRPTSNGCRPPATTSTCTCAAATIRCARRWRRSRPQLDPARFVRVHRSYMVNLDCIGEIEPLDTGDARIVMRDGTTIPCSRRYRDALRPERVA